MRRKHLFAFVPLLALAPLLVGCAAGVGNFGPGTAEVYRTGTRHETSLTDGQGHTAPSGYHYVRSYEEHDRWKGSFTLGVGVGPEQATLTDMRDTTVARSRWYHTDVVVNLPGDKWGIGATVGYRGTEFTSSTAVGPRRMKYNGIVVGPMLFRRISHHINIDGSAQYIFGSLEDPDAFYLKPVYGMLDTKQPLPGKRYQADVNLFLVRSERFDLGVRAGYQWTTTAMTDVYLKQRQFKSEGPVLELIGLTF